MSEMADHMPFEIVRMMKIVVKYSDNAAGHRLYAKRYPNVCHPPKETLW